MPASAMPVAYTPRFTKTVVLAIAAAIRGTMSSVRTARVLSSSRYIRAALATTLAFGVHAQIAQAQYLVTPDGASATALANTGPLSLSFTLENNEPGYALIDASCVAEGSVSSCQIDPVFEMEGYSQMEISVTYYTGASGMGTLRVIVEGGDQAWYTITVEPNIEYPAPPIVVIESVNPGAAVEKAFCLTVALSRDAASECGELRITHALPATRTMNRVRSPTLLYNSQEAHPYPLVAANVTLPATATPPNYVEAVLRIGGVVRGGTRTWNGGEWAPGATRRIVVGFDAITEGLATGIHDYTLEVTNVYGANRQAELVSGKLAIVNRASSFWGPGWWLAGLEQLDPMTMVWVGGDGSVRQYLPAGTGKWVATPLTHPDTISQEGPYFVRHLPQRVRVRFDAAGRHVATINRLGHETSFEYEGATSKLLRINLPPAGAPHYRFSYNATSGLLTTAQLVLSGSATGPLTSFEFVSGRLTVIRDPDQKAVSFGYHPTITRRVESRTDRRLTVTTFTYDDGHRLTQGYTNMGTGQLPLVTGLRPIETLGLAGVTASVDTSKAYARVDGPLTTTADTTLFWVTRYGSPRRIRNALGYDTFVSYDPAWPGLAARVRTPSGQITGVRYDARGNLREFTDSSMQQGAAYATTQYVFHPMCDMVEQITPPMGDVVSIGYVTSDSSCNRAWQQDQRGTTTRTTFGYGSSFRLLTSVDPPLSRPDSVAYDALGNVLATLAPYTRPNSSVDSVSLTMYTRNRRGADSIVLARVQDAVNFRPDRTIRTERLYDIMGRDSIVLTLAPEDSIRDTTRNAAGNLVYAHGINLAAARVEVRHTWDAEGNPISVRRELTETWRGAPAQAAHGPLTTSWVYDRASRRVKEVAPDGHADSMIYDPAGRMTAWITRRGHRIDMQYGLLGWLESRTTPAFSYQDTLFTSNIYLAGGGQVRFPRYVHQGTNDRFFQSGVPFPATTTTFSHDSAGNVLVASNPWSIITRTYFANGLLKTDRQRIRAYDNANDFTSHDYTLKFTYDLNGRRIRRQHPAQFGFQRYDTLTKYFYSSWGALDSLIDPDRRRYSYLYDAQGRVERLELPNNTVETRAYHPDGTLSRIYAWSNNPNSGFGRPETGLHAIHDWDLIYDDRGKVTSALDRLEWRNMSYTPVGGIAFTRERYFDMGYGWTTTEKDFFERDALGNVIWRAKATPSDAPEDAYAFENGTGRLAQSAELSGGNWVSAAPFVYDRAGNQRYTERSRLVTGCGAGYAICPMSYDSYRIAEIQADYYTADNKLAWVDRSTSDYYGNKVGGLEEYWYDALGRRILRRFREKPSNHQNESEIVRYVYDGDQILYEIRMPGHDTTPAAILELDTPSIYGGHPDAHQSYFGVVLNMHGQTLDRPLSVTRVDAWVTMADSNVVFPHADFRGYFRQGSTWSGARDQTHLKWEKRRQQTLLSSLSPFGVPTEPTWMGSLLDVQRDGSEQIYMRNRYYDPATGRFTQEDPIGLAGGLNLYGFADGDPVNFSDPFGLCPAEVSVWQAVGCVLIETTMGLLGSTAGFAAGGGAGLLAAAPTGGLAAPVTVPAGAVAGAAAGAVAGKLAGEMITSVLFSKGEGEFRGGRQSTRDADYARLRKEFNPDREQRTRIHEEIAKRKQGRPELDIDELREIFEEIVGDP